MGYFHREHKWGGLLLLHPILSKIGMWRRQARSQQVQSSWKFCPHTPILWVELVNQYLRTYIGVKSDLHRRFLCLCVLNQSNDLRETSVSAHTSSTHDQSPTLVHRASNNRSASSLQGKGLPTKNGGSSSTFATGIDSPVSMDSSIDDSPETTTPSAGILAPGRILRTSSTSIKSVAISFSPIICPPCISSKIAVFGCFFVG